MLSIWGQCLTCHAYSRSQVLAAELASVANDNVGTARVGPISPAQTPAFINIAGRKLQCYVGCTQWDPIET